MKITSNRSYVNENGNRVFVYKVSGTKDELEKYEAAMGEHFRKDDHGVPLWFTTRSAGPQAELIITPNGKVIADMSAFDHAASLAKQYNGNLGSELAKVAAEKLLGSNNVTPAPVTSVTSSEGLDKV